MNNRIEYRHLQWGYRAKGVWRVPRVLCQEP